MKPGIKGGGNIWNLSQSEKNDSPLQWRPAERFPVRRRTYPRDGETEPKKMRKTPRGPRLKVMGGRNTPDSGNARRIFVSTQRMSNEKRLQGGVLRNMVIGKCRETLSRTDWPGLEGSKHSTAREKYCTKSKYNYVHKKEAYDGSQTTRKLRTPPKEKQRARKLGGVSGGKRLGMA